MLFFFQAEDGIRDYKVTGVQTCALPICSHRSAAHAELGGAVLLLRERLRVDHVQAQPAAGARGEFLEELAHPHAVGLQLRSEERRVGKECRSRWSPYH